MVNMEDTEWYKDEMKRQKEDQAEADKLGITLRRYRHLRYYGRLPHQKKFLGKDKIQR